MLSHYKLRLVGALSVIVKSLWTFVSSSSVQVVFNLSCLNVNNDEKDPSIVYHWRCFLLVADAVGGAKTCDFLVSHSYSACTCISNSKAWTVIDFKPRLSVGRCLLPGAAPMIFTAELILHLNSLGFTYWHLNLLHMRHLPHTRRHSIYYTLHTNIPHITWVWTMSVSHVTRHTGCRDTRDVGMTSL